jgi:hypothetical protein
MIQKDVIENITYLLIRVEEKQLFILLLFYFDNFTSKERAPFIFKSFQGLTEAEALTKADNWIKQNIGENFERHELNISK